MRETQVSGNPSRRARRCDALIVPRSLSASSSTGAAPSSTFTCFAEAPLAPISKTKETIWPWESSTPLQSLVWTKQLDRSRQLRGCLINSLIESTYSSPPLSRPINPKPLSAFQRWSEVSTKHHSTQRLVRSSLPVATWLHGDDSQHSQTRAHLHRSPLTLPLRLRLRRLHNLHINSMPRLVIRRDDKRDPRSGCETSAIGGFADVTEKAVVDWSATGCRVVAPSLSGRRGGLGIEDVTLSQCCPE